MNRILILPNIQPAGYAANLKAGYRIYGGGRIPDIRPDFYLNIQISRKIKNKRRHQMYSTGTEGFLYSYLEQHFFFTSKQYRSRIHEGIFGNFKN
jgi:hypothetical protein